MKILLIIVLFNIINLAFAEPTREPSKELIEIDIPVLPPNSQGFDFSQPNQ